jgi:hypothetical protein
LLSTSLFTFIGSYFVEIFSNNWPLLFQKQSSLVKFSIIAFFSTSGFHISVSSSVNIHSRYKRTTYSWSSSNLW